MEATETEDPLQEHGQPTNRYKRYLFVCIAIVGIIILFICWPNGAVIIEIDKEFCNVDENKRSYDLLKNGTSECSITIEEQMNIFDVSIEDKDLLDWLQRLTDSWQDGKAYADALYKKISGKYKGLCMVSIFNTQTNVNEFLYLHHIRQGKDYDISVISGMSRREHDSSTCKQIDNVKTWNEDILKKARLYSLYKKLFSMKMAEKVLESTCPASKYNRDL